jgi:transcriptional regulator NrdR family protein
MNCPKCDHEKNTCLETRSSSLRPEWIHRRRKCSKCGERWNTLELPTADIAPDQEEQE